MLFPLSTPGKVGVFRPAWSPARNAAFGLERSGVCRGRIPHDRSGQEHGLFLEVVAERVDVRWLPQSRQPEKKWGLHAHYWCFAPVGSGDVLANLCEYLSTTI